MKPENVLTPTGAEQVPHFLLLSFKSVIVGHQERGVGRRLDLLDQVGGKLLEVPGERLEPIVLLKIYLKVVDFSNYVWGTLIW